MRHSPVTPAKGSVAASASVRARRPGPAPRPRVVDVCAALAGLGCGVTVGTVIIGEDRGSLAAAGGLFTAAGRLTGFTGAYLMLIMVVLAARLPWLEASVGQDRLVRWHRQVAPWAFGLIAAHVVLITLGYAQAAKAGVLRQLWVFVRSYPDLLAAIAGFGLLVMAGVTSIRIVRRRLDTRPGGSSTSMFTSGSRSRSPTRSSPASHSSATRSPGRSGSSSGPPRPGWSSSSGSPSRSGGASGIGCGSSRSAKRRQAWSRSSARAGGWIAWRFREASSSSGASSLGTCGGRRTRTRCPHCHSLPTSA